MQRTIRGSEGCQEGPQAGAGCSSLLVGKSGTRVSLHFLRFTYADLTPPPDMQLWLMVRSLELLPGGGAAARPLPGGREGGPRCRAPGAGGERAPGPARAKGPLCLPSSAPAGGWVVSPGGLRVWVGEGRPQVGSPPCSLHPSFFVIPQSFPLLSCGSRTGEGGEESRQRRPCGRV